MDFDLTYLLACVEDMQTSAISLHPVAVSVREKSLFFGSFEM